MGLLSLSPHRPLTHVFDVPLLNLPETRLCLRRGPCVGWQLWGEIPGLTLTHPQV